MKKQHNIITHTTVLYVRGVATMQKDNDDGRNESTDGESAGAGAGNDKNQTKNDRGSDSDSGSWNGWVVGETVMLPIRPRAEPLGEQENQNEQDDEESRQNEQG
jgi:hypothetical protein